MSSLPLYNIGTGIMSFSMSVPVQAASGNAPGDNGRLPISRRIANVIRIGAAEEASVQTDAARYSFTSGDSMCQVLWRVLVLLSLALAAILRSPRVRNSIPPLARSGHPFFLMKDQQNANAPSGARLLKAKAKDLSACVVPVVLATMRKHNQRNAKDIIISAKCQL